MLRLRQHGFSTDSLGVMVVLKVLARLALGLVVGWYALALAVYLYSALTNTSAWGVMHTGLPLLLLPFAWGFIYWCLGYIRVLAIHPRPPSVHLRNAVVRCSGCSKEISFNDAICPHCGMQFNVASNDA